MTPSPLKVELVPHDPHWAVMAQEEGKALARAVGSTLLAVHHIGSTAIPGISAKPILDLIPVVAELSELDVRKSKIDSLGYEWWGELGLLGRRYCSKSELRTADGAPIFPKSEAQRLSLLAALARSASILDFIACRVRDLTKIWSKSWARTQQPNLPKWRLL